MVVGLLVALIGFAASKMTDLGTTTYGSQKKYEIASAAAEFAVNQAVNWISLMGACPDATTSQIADTNKADYHYVGIQTNGYCFIRGQGTFRGAKVVKTVVVPDTSDFEYGALTLRNGGATATSGSSAIVSCDSACKSPAIVYGGSLTYTANLDKSTCSKGIYGVGEGGSDAIQNAAGVECKTSPCSGDQLSDRIPKIFNVPKTSDETQYWPSVQNSLDGTYNGFVVDVSALSVSGVTVPSNCQCAGTLTLSAAKVSGKQTILDTCSTDASFSATGCSAIQGDSVTVSGSRSISNTAIVGGTVTLSGGTITNSIITTTGTSPSVTLGDTSLSSSTIVTSGQFTLSKNSGTMTDTDVFAGTGQMISQGGTMSGGLIYTQGDFDFVSTTSGNNPLGTWDETTTPQTGNPILMLVGGDLDMTSMTGTTEINGLVFTQGIVETSGSLTGNFTVRGAIVSNSTSTTETSTINAQGNATISFNHNILDYLATSRTDLNSLVKLTACGGTFGNNKGK